MYHGVLINPSKHVSDLLILVLRLFFHGLGPLNANKNALFGIHLLTSDIHCLALEKYECHTL